MIAAVWTVVVVVILGLEGWSIIDWRPRNTWSYWFWKNIRAYLALRLVAYPLLLWTSWHWMLDTDHVDGDDLIAVVLGVVLAFVATTRRNVELTR